MAPAGEAARRKPLRNKAGSFSSNRSFPFLEFRHSSTLVLITQMRGPRSRGTTAAPKSMRRSRHCRTEVLASSLLSSSLTKCVSNVAQPVPPTSLDVSQAEYHKQVRFFELTDTYAHLAHARQAARQACTAFACAPRRATKRHAQPHCIAPQRLASLDRSVSPVTNVASAWPMTPRCRTHPRQCDAGRSPERRVGMLVSAPCWQGSQGRFERRAWLWQRKENGTTLTYLNTL